MSLTWERNFWMEGLGPGVFTPIWLGGFCPL